MHPFHILAAPPASVQIYRQQACRLTTLAASAVHVRDGIQIGYLSHLVHCYQQQQVAGCINGQYPGRWQYSRSILLLLYFRFDLRKFRRVPLRLAAARSSRFHAPAAEIQLEAAIIRPFWGSRLYLGSTCLYWNTTACCTETRHTELQSSQWEAVTRAARQNSRGQKEGSLTRLVFFWR